MKLFKKKYYWYSFNFIYKVNGKIIFNYKNELGFTKRKTILNHREVKKISKPLHLIDGVNKKYLRNGDLIAEPVCYLGRFSK